MNKALRLSVHRKPHRPHLHRQAGGILSATAPAGIHQQIAEPPSPASVGQTHTKEPNLIAAARGERRVYFVQTFHRESARLYSECMRVRCLSVRCSANALSHVEFLSEHGH